MLQLTNTTADSKWNNTPFKKKHCKLPQCREKNIRLKKMSDMYRKIRKSTWQTTHTLQASGKELACIPGKVPKNVNDCSPGPLNIDHVSCGGWLTGSWQVQIYIRWRYTKGWLWPHYIECDKKLQENTTKRNAIRHIHVRSIIILVYNTRNFPLAPVGTGRQIESHKLHEFKMHVFHNLNLSFHHPLLPPIFCINVTCWSPCFCSPWFFRRT